MALTLEQFGKALAASGLMTPEDVRAFWNAIPAAERPKDAEGFAERLRAQKLLTEFQAKQLLAGRGASLVMGDYAVLAEIGAGGMGQVYKARHRRMERIVALKVMSSAAMKDEAAVKRFQREVRAAARLEHPNIVTAYDSGEAGNVKYLVMQFVDGGDLSDLVKKNGPLPIEKAADYVIQAARGLAFAHAEGVIHRDIKPANLLLDKKGVVKILDMGLARIESSDDGLTATEQVMGTVDYMSPEQAANTKGADGRADIYSLGCTLWFLLTGKKAYEADTMIARLMAHREAPLPSLVKTRDDAPWALEQALHKMLAKRPQDRFQSMNEVVTALEPFSGGGSSKAGMGSSIGMGAQTNAELAAFFQNVGPKTAGPGTKTGGSKTEAEPKSATAAGIDATAAFLKPEADTDPKSQLLSGAPLVSRAAPVSRDAKQSAPARKKNPPVKLIAGGVLGVALLVVAGIIIKVRDKDGNVVAELEVPNGATVEVTPTAPAATAPAPIAAAPAMAPSKMLEARDYVWAAPENLGLPLNSERSQSEPTLTADELCLVCVSQPEGNLSELVECVRPSIDAPFGPPKRLTGATGEKEPCLSADGLTLIYAAEAGSFGKHDLWIRRRATRDAAWGAPVHLLQEVNSPDDERSPSLSLDGLALLFSSDRPGGMGRSDIWIARRKTPTGSFEKAVNFDPRLNSPGDETEPALLSDGQLLFLSNNDTYHLSFKAASGIFSSLPVDGLRGNDGWLSPDARRWYFTGMSPTAGRDIWLTRRVPGAAGTTPSTTPSASTEFLATVPVVAGNWTYGLVKPLFDGTSLAGWSGDTALVSIENGVLVNDGKRGVVIAPGEYRNFEVELDFRLAAVGNSGLGIFYPGDGDPAVNGLEVQLLDDAGYPNVHPKQRCGSLYQVSSATTGQYRAWPEWNHMVVRALGDQLQVVLNDVSILKVSKAELQSYNPGHAGLKRDSGKIALFPHTGRSEYRKFQVREATLGTSAAEQPTPPGDYALDFSNSEGAYLPDSLKVDLDQPFTLEITATPLVRPTAPTANSPVLNVGWFQLKQYFNLNNGAFAWSCVSQDMNEALTTVRAGDCVVGKPGRIAIVSTGKELRVFLDGKLVGTAKTELPKRRDRLSTAIGKFSRMGDWIPFQGILDEIRISKVARYDKDYTPTARLNADANTLALYHFDEGSGNTVKDASGNGHDATIPDVKWVRADGGPIGASPVEVVYLDDLQEKAWHGYQQLWKHGQGIGGSVLSHKGERVQHSLVLAPSKPGDLSFIEYELGGRFEKFEALTYLTREPTSGPQTFRVLADGKKLWESPPQTLPNVEADFSLSIKGVNLLRLEVAGIPSFSHPLWLEPRLTPSAGATVPADAADHALQFDGKQSHVALPVKHEADTPITIEATLLPGPAASVIVSNTESAGIGFGMENGKPGFLFGQRQGATNGYARVRDPKVLDTSRPHQLAMVYDKKKLRLFVDGKLAATNDFTGQYLPSPLPFMIGASPEATGIDYPFTGTIDEVRISKSARYTQDYAPMARLEADADTLALYHFDEGSGEVLRDSSGNGHNGRIFAAKWVRVEGSPKRSSAKSALHFQGRDQFVEIPDLGIDGTPPLTLEAWATPETSVEEHGNFVQLGAAGGYEIKLKNRLSEWHLLLSDTARPGVLQYVVGKSQNGRRDHVAGVWDGKELRIYVNGVASPPLSVNQQLADARPRGAGTIGFGASEGTIDEVRISKSVRYTGNFQPAQRWEPDADTLALFHFEEGSGNVLRDASGNGRDGKIVGATWVPGEAQTSAVASNAGGGLDLSAKLNPGAARVGLPQFLDREKPITVEMVVTPRSVPGAAAKNRKLWQFEFFDLKQYDDQWEWLANIYGDDGKRLPALTARGAVQPDKRAHLAGVWTGKELRFFVDGKLIGSTTVAKLPAPLTYNSHSLGGKHQDSVDYSPFDGILHEARISQSARYDRDYIPPDRLEADANTAALYRCNEGSGDVLRDSSGHGHDGRIIGATWVRTGNENALSPAPVGAGINLLPLVRVETPKDSAPWTRDASGVLMKAGPFARTIVDFAPPEEYEVHADVVPISGKRSFIMGLSRGGKRFWIAVSGWEKGLTKIEPTPTLGSGTAESTAFQLEANKPASLVFTVRKDRVSMTADGKMLIDWQGDSTTLPEWGYWRLPESEKLAIGSWVGDMRLTRLELRPLRASVESSLFNGTDLAGWKGDPKVWTWQAGELVGKLSGNGSTFLAGTKPYQDFELTYEVRLQGDQANSGVQFRSEMLPPSPYDMTGPQCEIGGTGKTGYGGLWWEKGPANGVKSAVPPEKYGPIVKPDDYNHMTVRCVGKHVTITLNGTTTVDGDFEIADRGLLGFQIVSRGAPVEARFRNFEFRDLSQQTTAAAQLPGPVVGGNNALALDETTTGVTVPRLRYDGSHPLTIEAWTEPSQARSAVRTRSRHVVMHPLLQLNHEQRDGLWVLESQTEKSKYYHSEPVRNEPAPGLVHVAAVLAEGMLKCFIDGKLRLVEPLDGRLLVPPLVPQIDNDVFYVGCGPEGSPTDFEGIIDEVRISRTARYSDDFTPAPRFDPDSDTLALYHFDEGAGTAAADASGNGYHLQWKGHPIYGRAAGWCAAPAPRAADPTANPERTHFGDAVEGTFGGHRYLLVRAKLTWNDAQAATVARGGHLASITSAAENDWLKNTLLDELPQERIVWIGGGRPADRSRPWGWDGGDPWGFTDWTPTEGNDGTGAAISFARPHGVGEPIKSWGDWAAEKLPMATSGPIQGRNRCWGYIIEWDNLNPREIKLVASGDKPPLGAK